MPIELLGKRPTDADSSDGPVDGRMIILGIGNLLMGDDGAGIHMIREIERRAAELPENTACLDGGTLGLELLDDIQGARALVVLDAVNTGADAGTLVQLRDDEITAVFGTRLSPHQVGVADLLASARLLGVLPPAVSLIGLQSSETGFSLELSESVQANLQLATSAAIAEAWALHRACHA